MFLKEINELYRFFWKTPKDYKKIVFYSENEGYHSYFEGIINELIFKHKCQISYVTSDPNDPILKESNVNLKSYYINKLLILFMQIVNCEIFIMTLTDLNRFHLKRSTYPVKYIYVYHAIVSTHMMYRPGAFDNYDTIFCVGPHHIKEIRKQEELYKLKNKELINAGYYRLERIYKDYKIYNKKSLFSSSEDTVLIAPSWGNENILKSCGIELIDLLISSNYNVIVRPHPETIKRDPNLLKDISAKFSNNKHFLLETSISSDKSIFESDILICDCSGVSLEYAMGTERPVIFLDYPIKIKNPNYKEIDIDPIELSLRSKMGLILSPEEIDQIPNAILKIKKKANNYKHILRQLRKENLFAFGKSSEIGANYIINALKS
tara:strand:- start:1851 stop:2984 length:1134 start_codon:yes stop_codon:yes gene_type:complete